MIERTRELTQPDAIQNRSAYSDLMGHIRFLAADLGPRRPASPAERAATDYIQEQLAQNGVYDVQRETFEATPQLAYKVVPPFLIGTLGMFLSLGRHPLRRVLGALLAFAAAFLIPSAWRLRRMPWELALPRAQSQNLIARIKPTGNARRQIVIVANLDSAHHKFTADPQLVFLTPFLAPLAVAGLILGGLLSLIDKLAWLRLLIMPAAALGALHHSADDLTGIVPGANDNASGLAIALNAAQSLHDQPLTHTEVVFAFVGCGESGGDGLHAFLDRHGDEFRNALFIDVEAVGTGELCYVTRHGLNPLSAYDSDPDALRLADQVAGTRPELGIMGKPMLMVNGLSILADRGFRGLTLTGYDRLNGRSPNRHRYSDTVHAIQPETMERAAQFLHELLKTYDA